MTHHKNITDMSFPELIRGEEEVLMRLLLVSQRQLEIAESGNATVLIEHLGQRQQLWHEFECLEQQLAPHKGVPPEHRVWKSAEERRQTEAVLNRCKGLLEQILLNDQKSMERTVLLRDEVGEQLRRIQRTSTVAPAYMKQSQIQ